MPLTGKYVRVNLGGETVSISFCVRRELEVAIQCGLWIIRIKNNLVSKLIIKLSCITVEPV